MGGGTGRWRKNSLLLLPLRFPLSLLVAKENGASYDVYCSLVSAEAPLNGVFSGLCDDKSI